MVYDGQSNKGHDSSADQQVADGQVYDQHWRHRVERFGCSHSNNDKNVPYVETLKRQRWKINVQQIQTICVRQYTAEGLAHMYNSTHLTHKILI